MSDKRLAVVTGAARGIGRAIVLELLKQGRIVAGIDLNAGQLEEMKGIVKEAGFEVRTECLDITDSSRFTATPEELAEQYAGIGIVVKNAGMTKHNLLLRSR